MIELLKFYSSLIVSFCGIIVWPVVVCIIIFLFRNSFKKILENLWDSVHPSEVNLPGNVQLKFQENQIRENKAISETRDEELVNQADVSPLNNKNEADIRILLKSLDESQNSNSELKDQLNASLVRLHFEFVHNYIFASQYKLLQLIENSELGYSMMAVESYFLALPITKSTNWTYVDYIKFILDTDLTVIDSQTGNIKITALGQAYLKYSHGLPMPFYLT